MTGKRTVPDGRIVEIIAQVESALASLNFPPVGADRAERVAAWVKAGNEAVASIVRQTDGHWSRTGDMVRLRIADIAVTSTCGPAQLLLNWKKAAMRKIGLGGAR
jgi:hypothetical protein